MQLLTILQLMGIFVAYFAVTLLLPCLLLYPKVKHLRLSVRFFIYMITGNFYIMNLVFLLELLHISNTITLILFTVVPYSIFFSRVHHLNLRARMGREFAYLQKLAGGQLGWRTFFRRCRIGILRKLKSVSKALWKILRANLFDCLLAVGLSVLILWLYGSNSLYTYGYCASDVPVHNYWINYLGKNQIFVAGVYPFGFHCVIYYLHAVFQIDTYVLLRLFCVVQTWLIHMVLLAFIRACCKTKYAAYAGVGIYAVTTIFNPDTFSRYYSTLPQEFGMLFILPAIYFALAFFQKKSSEITQKEEKKTADWNLVFFALSFSMTLAAHFYDTMIAGLFCLGIAAAYIFCIFRREFFWKIIAAGLIGIVIAVLPMGISFAAGTPLQGSLGWGMNIIAGADKNEASDTESAISNTAGESPSVPATETETEAASEVPGGSSTSNKTSQETEPQNTVILVSDTLLHKFTDSLDKIESLGLRILDKIDQSVITYLTYESNSLFATMILLSIGLLFLLGAIFYLLRQLDYAARLMATAVFMVLMSMMQASGELGIPELMDASRTSIFYAYMLPIVWGLCLDAGVYLLLGWTHRKRILHLTSLTCVALIAAIFVWKGKIKEPARLTGLESNAAVTCLTNIISDNKDETWTICSANDELRMGEDHGYHYELIEFLSKMNHSGAAGFVQIPTHEVYFFIEKVPIDYTQTYSGSGQSVSEKGASEVLPGSYGISVYKGENRWNVMSHMYYWAQTFRKMYPNEMKVYYETEDFVCYLVEQNDYSLYNLAIDYGYNTP